MSWKETLSDTEIAAYEIAHPEEDFETVEQIEAALQSLETYKAELLTKGLATEMEIATIDGFIRELDEFQRLLQFEAESMEV